MIRKTIKILLKTILGIGLFLLIYLGMAFVLSRIEVGKITTKNEDIRMYILSNGVHTDLVVPIKTSIIDWSKDLKFANTTSKDTNHHYLALGWGDKGFYLETPEWKDLKASVAINAAFGLSNTAIHATYYNALTVNDNCKEIMISSDQYKKLVGYIQNSLEKDANGNSKFIPTKAVYGQNDAFYEAHGSYSMLHTCNTWANNGLKACGQKCCVWTPFDTGIFHHYK
jgi:uncharacterized protein (TIGR02117 family)